MRLNDNDKSLRVSDIVYLNHVFIEKQGITVSGHDDVLKMLKVYKMLLQNMISKVGLMPGDDKYLAHVLISIIDSIYSSKTHSSFIQDKNLTEMLLDAMINIMSSGSMKVRSNIQWIRATRLFSVDRQTFSDLALALDYLNSAYKLHTQTEELEKLLLKA